MFAAHVSYDAANWIKSEGLHSCFSPFLQMETTLVTSSLLLGATKFSQIGASLKGKNCLLHEQFNSYLKEKASEMG